MELHAQSNNTLPPALAKPSNPVRMLDIYRQVEAIKQLINQFMFAMGKKMKVHPRIIVENAQPQDVLFQSTSIYNKTSRLAFQYTRSSYQLISMNYENKSNMEHIWQILHKTLLILYRLQPILDIRQPLVVKTPSKPVSLTDMSSQLIQLNQLMDDMGWVQASPSETYSVLTKAVELAAALNAHSPLPQTIPNPPAFERGKTPAQVYRRLLTIMDMLNQISDKQQIPSIKIHVYSFKDIDVNPSDVNDMTHFIIARLEIFYSLINPKVTGFDVYYYGWKLPSDIYQRAGILKRQIKHLDDTINKYPSWLRGNPKHG